MESEARSNGPVDDVASPSPSPNVPQSDSLKMGTGRIIGFALVGAAIFVVICIAVFPVFRFLPKRLSVPFPPPKVAVEREATTNLYQMYNAIIALSILGALVGGCLAFGESFTRGFRRRNIGAVILAVFVGAAMGALAGFAGHMLQNQLAPIKGLAPMGRTVLVQMLTLAVLGIGLGIGVGLAAGGVPSAVRRAGFGGTAGLLSGLLFPVVCAFVVSRAKTEVVVPGGVVWGRSEWLALVLWAGLFVLILGFVLPMEHKRKTAAS